MIRILPSVFILILLLSGCRNNSRNEEGNVRTVKSYDTTKTAVIVLDQRSKYPFETSKYSAASVSQEEVEQIERYLIEAVDEHNNSLSVGHDNYKIDLKGRKYKKQLVAVTNPKGEKEVWVNCFCGDWDKAWRTRIVMVQDGGPCYFNFKLNLKTKKVYDFGVNGFA